MASLRDIVQFPRDAYTLLKMVMKARKTLKQIPAGPHWAFCYDMQYKLFRGFTLLNQQLDTDRLRDVLCVYHLIIRAIDTIEDDTSISNEVKLPILKEFHRHIYDPEWHFSCGSKKLHKVLMDGFHHVRAAFLELESSYQQAIVDHTIRMGAGMAKFLCKEVETIDDYDEYCDTITGSGVIAMSKMFHASGTEDLAPDALAISFGVFVQKMDVIMDYLEDINEKPTPRKFWPREIWSKYANKLEDFKYEENSVKAVQCLNEMVTNALAHLEESMKYVFTFQDSTLFRLFGTALIVAVGTLALCYNNIQVFRRAVKVRGGLAVKIVTRTKTRSDVYGAVHDFSRMLKSKACLGMSETHSQLEMLRGNVNVADNDPNAGKTKDILDAILKTCRDSGNLDDQRESYIIQSMPQYSATLIAIIFAMSAILLAYLVFASRPTNTCKLFFLNFKIVASVILEKCFTVLACYLLFTIAGLVMHSPNKRVTHNALRVALLAPGICLHVCHQQKPQNMSSAKATKYIQHIVI